MMSALISVSRGSNGCLRAKARRRLVSSAPRRAAAAINLVASASCGLSPTCNAISQNADDRSDRREHVVEVVRYAAGQLADRFHLLRLAHLFLGSELRGDVAHQQVVNIAAAPAYAAHRYFHLDLVAVLAHRIDLEAFAFDTPRLPQKLVHGQISRAITLWQIQVCDRSAHRLLTRPAEDHLRLRVPLQDFAKFVDLDDRVKRRIDDAARHALAVDKRLLRLLALGHVATDEEVALLGVGPHATPGERYEPAVPVYPPGLEISSLLPATRDADFRARSFEIVWIDEFGSVATYQLFGGVARNRLAAGAHSKNIAGVVRR